MAGFRLVLPRHRGGVTRYTWLIEIGEAQAWLARTWRDADSGWTRIWALALWAPTRACFCAGYWLVVPPERPAG
jgi:hypothetical protein